MFGPLSRRDAMKLSAAGVLGVSMSGWLDVLAVRAAEAKAKTAKSVILLWMDGGPSHKDTFDLKPGTEHGGPYQTIKTSAPGIEISEHLPKLAQVMNHGVVLRGMSTGEGAHGRAKYYLHTGYKEGVGGVVHPSIGSIVSKEIGNPDFPLPNFVSIGNRGYGSGYLGARHQPLMVADATRGVENLRAVVDSKQFSNRIGLLEEMEEGFFRTYKAESISAHKTMYSRAVDLMNSPQAKAFDITLEPSASREKYGSGRFAEGCLLARRLVEVGVKFVEVTLGGWDTHTNNFDRVKTLSGQIDSPMAALVNDLKARGLLDSTLVIWMGDFGRTPRINNRGAQPGRDHYPRAWSSVMLGGGIKAGQVIGKTDKEGATVIERPISTLDFMATVCGILDIDPKKEYTTSNKRPIKIVDKGAKAITEIIAGAPVAAG
jgi:hypothetical protein